MKTENGENKKRRRKISHGTADVIRKVLWISFFVLVVVMFIWCFNITYNFVLERDQTDIPALIGQITEDDGFKVFIPMGSTTKDIAAILEKENLISNAKIFAFYSRLMGNDNAYKSGFHLFNKNVDYDNPIGYDMIIHILSQNPLSNPTQRIFFAEGLTFNQTLMRFSEYDFISTEKFLEASKNAEFSFDFVKAIPDNPHRINRLEGYLFPDTYIFDITHSEEAAIYKMLNNFNDKFKNIYRARAEAMGLTIDEVIIIASLIEKEAKKDEERPIIAGVIYNRLKTTDPSLRRLQIDATIQYLFLNETGEVKEKLLTEDTRIDSPYNTYMYEGLPPGPICNPGEKSIIAALYPDENNYYFYVAKGDGYHAFSRTYDEHLANVRKYID